MHLSSDTVASEGVNKAGRRHLDTAEGTFAEEEEASVSICLPIDEVPCPKFFAFFQQITSPL
jgi:hypothetical protein